jgi:5-hydroxyisourate hydrolase
MDTSASRRWRLVAVGLLVAGALAAPAGAAEEGRLTTHVLDTASGKPAAGMEIEFSVREGDAYRPLKTIRTNADGRTDAQLLGDDEVDGGVYELVFGVGEYFAGEEIPDPPFLGRVPVRFGIADPTAHYHVPLLVSPWSYGTYRGS